MIEFLSHIDTQFLIWIRDFISTENPIIRYIVISLSDLQPFLFAGFLILLWLYGTYEDHNGPKHIALDLFWHVLAVFILYIILNNLLPMRPRPELVSTIAPLIDHLPDNSFPSWHAIFWGASWWALVVLLSIRRVSLFFFILWFLTCLSRIISGIHYPGDILVGFFLGWWMVHILMRLRHGNTYLTYCHDLPIKIMKYFHL